MSSQGVVLPVHVIEIINLHTGAVRGHGQELFLLAKKCYVQNLTVIPYILSTMEHSITNLSLSRVQHGVILPKSA